MTRGKIEKKYLRRAKFIAYLLRLAPFIRMVGLNGSLPMGKATKDSDIDFFIVTQKDRIWTGRIFATLLVQLTGLRRYGEKIAGRICLNRYQTEDSLVLHPKDKKNAYHHSFMMPLWQSSELFSQFTKKNQWIGQFEYNFRYKAPKNDILTLFWLIFAWFWQILGELLFDFFLGDWGEKLLGNYQKKRIKRDPRTKKSPIGCIFVSDKELRFLPPKNFK